MRNNFLDAIAILVTQILVLEFMPGGTLRDHLSGKTLIASQLSTCSECTDSVLNSKYFYPLFLSSQHMKAHC